MVLTKTQYASRWTRPEYAATVVAQAMVLKSDGCSCIPDLYLLGCYEHDIAYRTGRDPWGYHISKDEADERFRWFIQLNSRLGRFNPISWARWLAVQIFGRKAWGGVEPLPRVYVSIPRY